MSSDKLKLTPESKRTLLEQSLQWIGSLKLQKDSDKNLPVFFSFSKLILINQSFLNTSRYASFGIYEFYLDYDIIWGLIKSDYLRFKSKHAGYFKGIKLSFERDYKLTKLLQPPKIGLKFDNEIKTKDLNELIEILKVTKSEISMEFTCRIVPFHDMMSEFSSRICRFSCDGKFFTCCAISSFGSLDELKVHKVENTDQFLHISKCNARSLDLSFVKSIFVDSTSLELPINNAYFSNKTVKHLRLYIKSFEHATTKHIIKRALRSFPSLVELEIDEIPSLYGCSKGQILDVASYLYQYMRSLKDYLFANGLKKIALKFNHQLYYDEKCNSKSIIKTFDKTEFSDWEYEIEYQWPSYYFGSNCRDVIMKFSTKKGNNCKFGIELKITHKTETLKNDKSVLW